jgi:hypothetical protein
MFLTPLLKTVSPPTLRKTPDFVSVEVKNYIFNFVPLYREDFLTNGV